MSARRGAGQGVRRPLRLLTIAGSDSGGGAGIQADLKTFAALGAFGMSALSAITAQNTRRVSAVHVLPGAMVAAQIDAVFEDLGVDGVKIGMLANAEIIEAVADRLGAWAGPPVVLDPVMVAKSGDALLEDEAVEALAGRLLPLATLVTPNLPECRRLTGQPVDDEAARRRAAERLAARGPAVLVKGGHAAGAEIVDLLYDGRRFHRFRHPRVDTSSTHGTGCTLSSAIAVGLAAGRPLADAVGRAIDYLQGALAAAPGLGGGHGPLDHLWQTAGESQ